MNKLFIIILFVFSHSSIAICQSKVFISFKSEPLISALNQLSKNYNIRFAYDIDLVSNISVTCDIKGKTENEAIASILKETQLEFQYIGGVYVLKPVAKKIISQEFIQIAGIVKDLGNGETLPYANIQLNNSPGGASANKDGFFSFQAALDDTIKLNISYLGYQTKRIIYIPSINTKLLLVELERKDNLLNEVVLISNLGNPVSLSSNSGGYSLNTSKLDNLPNFGEVDILQALQIIPGISATEDASSGLVIRGCPSDQNLVLYDGFTIYHLDHFFGIFSALNSKNIKDIRVFKSDYDVKYGGRAAGIVDITGKSGNSKKASIEMGLNMLSADISVELPISKKITFIATGRRSYTDIIHSQLYKSLFDNIKSPLDETTLVFGGIVEHVNTSATPDYYYADFNSKLSWKPSVKDDISLSYYIGKDNFSIDNKYKGQIFSMNSNYHTDWGNNGLGLKWSRQWNSRYFSKLSFGLSNFYNDFTENSKVIITSLFNANEKDMNTTENNNLRDYNVMFDNTWNINASNRVEYGLNWSDKNFDYYYSVDDINSQQIKNRGDEISAYLQNTFFADKPLSLTLGTRSTYFSFTEKVYNEPRIRLTYTCNKYLQFRASASKHYQFITKVLSKDNQGDSRFFWFVCDGETFPVISSNHYSAGANWNLKSFSFDIELYRSTFNGLIEQSLSDVGQQFYNGNGTSNGIDFFVQQKGHIYNLWLSYSLSKVINAFDEFNNGKSFPSSNDQLHEIKIYGNITLKKFEISANWIFGSGKPYSIPFVEISQTSLNGEEKIFVSIPDKNTFRLPPYHRMDVSVTYNFKIGKVNFQFGGSVINVYGRNNIKYRNYQYKNLGTINGTNYEIIEGNNIKSLGITPSLFLNLKI